MARRDPADTGVPDVSQRSWWLEEALRVDPAAACPALAGEVTADVCGSARAENSGSGQSRSTRMQTPEFRTACRLTESAASVWRIR
jgi:hypothetical protein